MTTPTVQISMSDVRSELGLSGQISLNDQAVRKLSGISGFYPDKTPIDLANLRGKTYVPPPPPFTVYTANRFGSRRGSGMISVALKAVVTGVANGSVRYTWTKTGGASRVNFQGSTSASVCVVEYEAVTLQGGLSATFSCEVSASNGTASDSCRASFSWERNGGIPR